MNKSYKVKLKPTKAQIDLLYRTWEGYRVAYNFAVAREIEFFDSASREEANTGKRQPKFLSAFALSREWTQFKKTLGGEIYNISARTTVDALHDVYSACETFFAHAKGHAGYRKKKLRHEYCATEIVDGQETLVPYLFKKDDGTPVFSLYYRTGAPTFKSFSDPISFSVEYKDMTVVDNGVYIRGMSGSSKIKEDNFYRFVRKGYVPTGTHNDENGTRYINPRISFDGIDWWLSVTTDFSCEKPELNKGDILAFDAGVENLATLDDGTAYASPKDLENYKKAYAKMLRLKSLVDHKKERIKKLKTENGTNSSSFKKLCKRYYKALIAVNNIKSNYLHNCSRQIVNRLPEVIAMEDLSVANMLKNEAVDIAQKRANGKRSQERILHRNIATSGMYTFQNMVSYKAQWNGTQIQKVPSPYTSKMCSHCGHIYQELTLDMRSWTCPNCGTYHASRDVNAAINIKHKAEELLHNPKPVKVKKSRPRIRKKVAQ